MRTSDGRLRRRGAHRCGCKPSASANPHACRRKRLARLGAMIIPIGLQNRGNTWKTKSWILIDVLFLIGRKSGLRTDETSAPDAGLPPTHRNRGVVPPSQRCDTGFVGVGSSCSCGLPHASVRRLSVVASVVSQPATRSARSASMHRSMSVRSSYLHKQERPGALAKRPRCPHGDRQGRAPAHRGWWHFNRFHRGHVRRRPDQASQSYR